MILTNLTVPDKQSFSGKLLVRHLYGQLFNLIFMYKFSITLLYNDEEYFCDKTELLNFRIVLPLAKLDMAGSRLVSNGLIFSDDILVNIQSVAFYCYPILVN